MFPRIIMTWLTWNTSASMRVAPLSGTSGQLRLQDLGAEFEIECCEERAKQGIED